MSIIPGFSSQRSNVFDPLSLELWDPFDRCPFLKDLLSPSPPAAADQKQNQTTSLSVLVDWRETPEAHVFTADLPGLKKEDVKVEVEDGGVLQISGERRQSSGGQDDKWRRIERGWGRFLRRLRLPEDAKVEGVKAEMENGVLTVTVPKMEVKKPEVKTIEISG